MEAGPLGSLRADCLHCTTPYLDEASFCYHCGQPRAAAYTPLGCGQLFRIAATGLIATGLLSFGGCSVVFGMNERGAEGLTGVGFVCLVLGVLVTVSLVRSLKR